MSASLQKVVEDIDQAEKLRTQLVGEIMGTITDAALTPVQIDAICARASEARMTVNELQSEGNRFAVDIIAPNATNSNEYITYRIGNNGRLNATVHNNGASMFNQPANVVNEYGYTPAPEGDQLQNPESVTITRSVSHNSIPYPQDITTITRDPNSLNATRVITPAPDRILPDGEQPQDKTETTEEVTMAPGFPPRKTEVPLPAATEVTIEEQPMINVTATHSTQNGKLPDNVPPVQDAPDLKENLSPKDAFLTSILESVYKGPLDMSDVDRLKQNAATVGLEVTEVKNNDGIVIAFSFLDESTKTEYLLTSQAGNNLNTLKPAGVLSQIRVREGIQISGQKADYLIRYSYGQQDSRLSILEKAELDGINYTIKRIILEHKKDTKQDLRDIMVKQFSPYDDINPTSTETTSQNINDYFADPDSVTQLQLKIPDTLNYPPELQEYCREQLFQEIMNQGAAANISSKDYKISKLEKMAQLGGLKVTEIPNQKGKVTQIQILDKSTNTTYSINTETGKVTGSNPEANYLKSTFLNNLLQTVYSEPLGEKAMDIFQGQAEIAGLTVENIPNSQGITGYRIIDPESQVEYTFNAETRRLTKRILPRGATIFHQPAALSQKFICLTGHDKLTSPGIITIQEYAVINGINYELRETRATRDYQAEACKVSQSQKEPLTSKDNPLKAKEPNDNMAAFFTATDSPTGLNVTLPEVNTQSPEYQKRMHDIVLARLNATVLDTGIKRSDYQLFLDNAKDGGFVVFLDQNDKSGTLKIGDNTNKTLYILNVTDSGEYRLCRQITVNGTNHEGKPANIQIDYDYSREKTDLNTQRYKKTTSTIMGSNIVAQKLTYVHKSTDEGTKPNEYLELTYDVDMHTQSHNNLKTERPEHIPDPSILNIVTRDEIGQ